MFAFCVWRVDPDCLRRNYYESQSSVYGVCDWNLAGIAADRQLQLWCRIISSCESSVYAGTFLRRHIGSGCIPVISVITTSDHCTVWKGITGVFSICTKLFSYLFVFYVFEFFAADLIQFLYGDRQANERYDIIFDQTDFVFTAAYYYLSVICRD